MAEHEHMTTADLTLQSSPPPRVLRAAGAGARHIAPVVIGLVPLGVAIGVAAAASPLDDGVGWATGPILFSGASQLTAIDLLGSRAGAATVLLSILVLNARFVLYSAALAPMLSDQPAWFRGLAPYFLVDPIIATVSDPAIRADGDTWWRWHFLGAASTLWVTWLVAMAAGLVLGPRVDPSWGLDLAAPLCLTAILGRRLHDGTGTVAATAGAVAALLAFVAPSGAVVLGATVAGTAAAASMNQSRR
jgi:predicted branched-subunit amino acid permease